MVQLVAVVSVVSAVPVALLVLDAVVVVAENDVLVSYQQAAAAEPVAVVALAVLGWVW